jgi:hypothetical protein
MAKAKATRPPTPAGRILAPGGKPQAGEGRGFTSLRSMMYIYIYFLSSLQFGGGKWWWWRSRCCWHPDSIGNRKMDDEHQPEDERKDGQVVNTNGGITKEDGYCGQGGR